MAALGHHSHVLDSWMHCKNVGQRGLVLGTSLNGFIFSPRQISFDFQHIQATFLSINICFQSNTASVKGSESTTPLYLFTYGQLLGKLLIEHSTLSRSRAGLSTVFIRCEERIRFKVSNSFKLRYCENYALYPCKRINFLKA